MVLSSWKSCGQNTFPDVPLVFEEVQQVPAHSVILTSRSYIMTRKNSQFVAASLTEFLSVWSMAGEANLNLFTKGGNLDIQFSLSLGNPGAPFSPSPPAPPPHKACHRGRAQKERNRARAARHQAAKTADLSVSSIDPATASRAQILKQPLFVQWQLKEQPLLQWLQPQLYLLFPWPC